MKKYNHLIYARIDKDLNIILLVGAIVAFVVSFFLYIAGNLMIYSLLNFIAGIVLLVFFLMARKIKPSIKIIIKNDRINTLIESIIYLSKQFKLRVVAEGVETKQQSDILKELGCYIIQGYYYSKAEKL